MPRKPTPPPGCDHFQLGAAVEISSNDDGFRGSWFTGTVLRRGDSSSTPSNRSKRQRTNAAKDAASSEKLWVQFDTIFNDEAGTSPVKELLHQHQLRPVPPKESRQKFSLNDEVDAFFNDGWWEGVVTEDLGNGKYELYFRASKESLQFGWESLRLHREWTNNSWIPPFDEKEQKALNTKEVNPEVPNAKKEAKPTTKEAKPKVPNAKEAKPNAKEAKPKVPNAKEAKPNAKEVKPEAPNAKKEAKHDKVTMGTKFKKGMLVEVSSDEDGYRGAWFLATIVKEIIKGKCVIQYKHLRTDDDTDFVKEEVDTLHIRPCPPEIKMAKGGFNLLDEVDALYNDGWWVGVISKVLKGSKYRVFFRDTDEDLEFPVSELRLHQEWIAGNWVVASQGAR